MASSAKPIPLKGGVESLDDVALAIGDNSREVHMQFEQMALLHGKPSNDCTYTTIQQLDNILRRGEIRPVTEACREYTHLDGQLVNLPPHTLLACAVATPRGARGLTPNFNPMGYQSDVFLHALGMPKIVGEGGVGVPSKSCPHIACSLPCHTS